MDDVELFRAADGTVVTRRSLREALLRVKADECDVLYVHSEMSFGTPNVALGRRGILEAVFETLVSLGVSTIVVPTFTFSFCNGTVFDRAQSRSAMGALNEFIRRLPESRRSRDPLLSVAVVGDTAGLIDELPPSSMGPGSTFDRLHRKGDAVRFLFAGVNPAKCFTYSHYVERDFGVPYRYDREFVGTIVDRASTSEETWTLFVRYAGVEPVKSFRFLDVLRSRQAVIEAPCGDSAVWTISEPAGFSAVADTLARDIDFFLEHPYPRDRRDTTFEAVDMVAL